ncbi:hypothetical protein DPEC_G00138800 [Dallia pectoralis]|uniref:Uncharacterized protein n=1 Tax=Dallia pectoralis TaxID=75939 RepID=A0ACC2GMA6_DALPE|nr:hypothetical protein DPEC_G00138800 [Dallia pectoralis]
MLRLENYTDIEKNSQTHGDKRKILVNPWFYLTLLLVGSLSNCLTLRDLWKLEWTPTIILTVNIVTSDLLLCLSFIFRIMYYLNCQVWSQEEMMCQVAVETMKTVFYINLYCNMMLLLWTSVIRYTTVVRPHPAILTPLTTTRGCWALCVATWATVVMVVVVKGVKTVSRGVKEDVRVSTEEKNSGQKRLENLGSKGGSLKVRRKILATVVVFVACFMPYHVQRAVTQFTPQEGDCAKVRFQWDVTNTTKAIAALSCVLHPLLYLAQRHLSCCQGRQ